MTAVTNKREIPVSRPALIGNERNYVLECLDSTWISSTGRFIGLFEERFAEYLGVKHAMSCCNGTAALHLAMLALGIGPGDEVIVPTVTFVATANAVRYTGATPVFADCELNTWNISADRVEQLITSRTKAVVPVPLYGHPCDMDPIMRIAGKRGIAVVEDAAEALGARYRGRLCGSIAHISTFSLYGNKTITTGEGGMVVTNDDGLAARVRILKGQGMDPQRRYWFPVIGYNYRMTNIEAAIGLAQIEHIERFVARRRQIASWYGEHLAGIPGVTLPVEKAYAVHSYWMYSIFVEQSFGMTRDDTMTLLAHHGVETRPVFYPMHSMPVYQRPGSQGLSVAEHTASQGINLPMYYGLEQQDVIYISNILRNK